ncbi:hypothetical protein QTO34_018207 [Cnephaeus nilssonii]|uniref:Serpin B6 n=1 Tax=Cnephaeus nilssonii TaxID=3371016 RepID=A0AA40HYG6_CNENI|nr:hypothetical protein QTO34_018207 [Eptesicus nilssonii]
MKKEEKQYRDGRRQRRLAIIAVNSCSSVCSPLEEQSPVQMMFQEATVHLAYIKEVKAQVLELPYGGEELSMLILLPKHYVDLSQRLGIADAFQWDKADFPSMSVRKELFLTNVVHKSFLEVNEEGTEAAAASDMDMAINCCGVVPARFCADHPFLFFVRHNKANCILFCGRFSTP